MQEVLRQAAPPCYQLPQEGSVYIIFVSSFIHICAFESVGFKDTKEKHIKVFQIWFILVKGLIRSLQACGHTSNIRPKKKLK